MEPSTTNSNEIHHKNLTQSTVDHDHDHQIDRDHDHELLIISCKPNQNINSSSHRAVSIGNTGSEISGREKVTSQHKEVSDVAIPDKWGQEKLLKDWMDYSTFDALLAPKEADSAREALVEEARRGYNISGSARDALVEEARRGYRVSGAAREALIEEARRHITSPIYDRRS